MAVLSFERRTFNHAFGLARMAAVLVPTRATTAPSGHAISLVSMGAVTATGSCGKSTEKRRRD